MSVDEFSEISLRTTWSSSSREIALTFGRLGRELLACGHERSSTLR